MAATNKNIIDFFARSDNPDIPTVTTGMLSRIKTWLEQSKSFTDEDGNERAAVPDDFIDDIWQRYKEQVESMDKRNQVVTKLEDTI